MTAVPLPAAAEALEVSTVTLRRWIAAGAPTARRGARGRGRATLVDVQSVAAWRACGRAAIDASAIPDVIAAAIVEVFDRATGLPKQRMAGLMAEAWYASATAVLDHLRETDDSVPDISVVPLPIARLRKIATQ